MSARWTSWLAVSLWTIAIALVFCYLVLMYANDRLMRETHHALIFTLFTLSLATAGTLLCIHRPRNPIGWIFLVSSLTNALAGAAVYYADYITTTAPGALPEITLLFWLGSWSYLVVFMVAPTFGLLYFPTGHLPSPRWQPFAWFLGIWLALAFAVEMFSPGPLNPESDWAISKVMNPVGIESMTGIFDAYLAVDGLIPVTPVLFLGAIASVFIRLRVATPVERLQIKWFAYVAPIPLIGLIVEEIIIELSNNVTYGDSTTGSYIAVVGVALLPVAIGIAILRHNLYDIDRLINRTLVYGSLTALLGLGFIGSILCFQIILSPFTNGNDLEVAGSTLLIFALFRPLRVRLQRFVDRRFYRQKYDAERTLQEFGTKARDAVDLDEVSTELTAVLATTMQPQHVSLWLRTSMDRDRT
jgi:hypothetical protein